MLIKSTPPHPELGNHGREAVPEPSRVHPGSRDSHGGLGRAGRRRILPRPRPPPRTAASWRTSRPSPLSVTDEKPNSWEQITTYNNYYEFGTDKDSPSLYAKTLKTEPWTVMVEGECRQAGQLESRGHPQGPDARGAHLPAPLRRSVVDGDSLGRLPALGLHQEGASRPRRPSSSSSTR